MVFSLTSEKRIVQQDPQKTSPSGYLKDFGVWIASNPSWLEDQGFGGIQPQVITSSTIIPELEFSNPGQARAFDSWYKNIAKGGADDSLPTTPIVDETAQNKLVTGGIDPVPSEFVPARCLPIYWEEKVSDPIDIFDQAGIKTGYKIIITGAGYTTTNSYDLDGVLTTTKYKSLYGDWSQTNYEMSSSETGHPVTRVITKGGNGSNTWNSLELIDSNNNLIESSFKSSDGYTSAMKQRFDSQNNLLESTYESSDGSKSHTKQTFQKAADGSIEKIINSSEGSGTGYQYTSYSEYDASWNLLSSKYSDGNGYSSSTARAAFVDEFGIVQGYSIISEGKDSNGYWYKSTERLDADNNLIYNSYEDSYGYFSKRTTEKQQDTDWGEVIIMTDASGSENEYGKITYNSTTKYTLDWRAIESENTDSYGYSSKLTTAIKTSASGEKIYVQTYQFKYPDGYASEWTTEYNEQWWPLVDGKPVDDLPLLYKLPRAAELLEPEIVPTVTKTATEEFEIQTISASDIFSEQIVMSIVGKRDKLVGSEDSDVFMVNDRGDRIIAGQKGASDSVMTENFSLDLRHKKWEGIENAMLVGSESWNLTGDTESNVLSGNGSNNILRGGAGVDTLFGGGGEDIFVISEEINTIDEIIDFESGEDKIALTGRVFRALFDKKRQLKDGVIGEKLKIDEVGVLWFDADGTGKKDAFKIAVIGVQDSLDQSDFMYTSY
jgi:hypothetical protein